MSSAGQHKGLHSLMNLQAQNAPITHERRRRESSFTQTLDDPLKYMELVRKTLGQNDEEKTPKNRPSTLENIDEEAISTGFLKKQFSNFTLASGQPQEMPRTDDNSSSRHSQQTFYPETRSYVHMNRQSDEQDLVPPTMSMGSDSRRCSSNNGEFLQVPIDLNMNVTQIAKQFGLQQTYDTLEGH